MYSRSDGQQFEAPCPPVSHIPIYFTSSSRDADHKPKRRLLPAGTLEHQTGTYLRLTNCILVWPSATNPQTSTSQRHCLKWTRPDSQFGFPLDRSSKGPILSSMHQPALPRSWDATMALAYSTRSNSASDPKPVKPDLGTIYKNKALRSKAVDYQHVLMLAFHFPSCSSKSLL